MATSTRDQERGQAPAVMAVMARAFPYLGSVLVGAREPAAWDGEAL